MRFTAAVALALLWTGGAASAAPPLQTVCTITVNSPDEKEAFRRFLPPSKYRFVELVERNRADWLASACRASISCDVLIVSGHYDGENEFFSDRLEVRDFLPVDELERASCSDSCPGVFANLKEVYLFGCNTLNPLPLSSASAEVVRSLVREGHSLKAAQQQLQALAAGHDESSRDRMRQVFWNVPVIYGFSSVAPLGPIAASTLGGYFRGAGAGGVGQGRPSAALLAQFAPFGMAAAPGMTARDPHAGVRHDVCQFVDDRLPDAAKLAFVHQLLQRPPRESRIYLDRIHRYTTKLAAPERQTPELTQALALLAQDEPARKRFLDFARATELPAARSRMLQVAAELGWLTAEQRWTELALMLGDVQARDTLGVTEVDLACTLNAGHELNGAFSRRFVAGGPADDVAHAAVRACLGSSEARSRTLRGLVSTSVADVQIAQAFVRHHPVDDPAELRQLAQDIVRMPASDAQVRALESLGRHYVSDRAILDLLVQLYAQTPSAPVQAAVAGILIRADRGSIASPQLVRTLQQSRRPAARGDNMIDALIARLRTP